MRFEFATATRVVFGAGVAAEVPALAAAWGDRALLVTGRSGHGAEAMADGLAAAKIAVERFPVAAEPTTEVVEQAVARAREAGCQLVIGLGGGSALDLGKAVAALLANGGEPLDYLEVIGRSKPLTRRSAPYVAVPTTAGTGAEVTRNAVLASPQHGVKVSLRSPLMLPHAAVVDPELTYSVPAAVTAATGLDALTQVLEPYVSQRATWLTDPLCVEGLRRAARSLRSAYRDGRDTEARADMALVSLLGGLALANAGLGAVHGFAGTLGGMLGAAHGVICARLLPFVMAANVRALEQRAPNAPALRRYGEVARVLTGRPAATAADGVAWVSELCSDLGVPPLRDVGFDEAAIDEVVRQSKRASSMKPNPIELRDDELAAILAAAR
jgi:alcohol dehydrogenase class IV